MCRVTRCTATKWKQKNVNLVLALQSNLKSQVFCFFFSFRTRSRTNTLVFSRGLSDTKPRLCVCIRLSSFPKSCCQLPRCLHTPAVSWKTPSCPNPLAAFPMNPIFFSLLSLSRRAHKKQKKMPHVASCRLVPPLLCFHRELPDDQ